MNRTIALFAIFLLVCSFAAAAQGKQGGASDGAGNDDTPQPVLISAGPGEGQGEQVQAQEREQTQAGETARVQAKAKNSAELQQMYQNRKQEMEQEMEGLDNEGKKNAYKNQNQVRLAVHALLAMEGLVGGIGPQVREVARNFDNSVQKTLQAEEKINNRGGLARFFAGGDADSAEELETEAAQNRERIQELKQLKGQCQCEESVRAMFEAQIQSMEGEQERLEGLALKEKSSKGLLGWMWK